MMTPWAQGAITSPGLRFLVKKQFWDLEGTGIAGFGKRNADQQGEPGHIFLDLCLFVSQISYQGQTQLGVCGRKTAKLTPRVEISLLGHAVVQRRVEDGAGGAYKDYLALTFGIFWS